MIWQQTVLVHSRAAVLRRGSCQRRLHQLSCWCMVLEHLASSGEARLRPSQLLASRCRVPHASHLAPSYVLRPCTQGMILMYSECIATLLYMRSSCTSPHYSCVYHARRAEAVQDITVFSHIPNAGPGWVFSLFASSCRVTSENNDTPEQQGRYVLALHRCTTRCNVVVEAIKVQILLS